MRLLTYDESGSLVFHTPDNNNLPAYAILSHTWHIDDSLEVSFDDLRAGRTTEKPGYKKIEFCAQKAKKDGLRYFWIDTCCINKSSDAELSESINSMFRWYQQATRCYVYLSDVTKKSGLLQPGESPADTWENAVRRSRWFQRGWTLQELMAPKIVVFYASNGDKLGDKSSLEALIHDVTGIAKDAIRGGSLADYSFDERMSWMASRSTKNEEDEVYSMLGIFSVSMSVIYGEGREKALKRLRKEVQETSSTAVPNEFAVSLSLSRIPKATEFVAREHELTTLHRLLYGHDKRSIAVLHGLGGIGKTQLAVAYLRRHKRQFSAIFWIDANSDDSILLGFRNVARQILQQHPSAPLLASVDLEGDPTRVAEAVISWLSMLDNTKWLLIYDNYDRPKLPGSTDEDVVDLARYIPQCDQGSIFVTTRSSRVDLGTRIHVKRLAKIEDGLAILSNASGRVDLEEDPEAIALVEELDGLPLALSTAGAYLERVATSFADYRRMYKASWLEVQKSSPLVTTYEDRSLYTTWQLSLDQIKREDEHAAKLVKLWAYFDRQDVWYELLCGGRACKWLERITQDRPTFDRTMRLLCSYGLVDPGSAGDEMTGSTGYSVHSCVHAWMMHVVNQEWDDKLARLALSCVASMVPSTDVNGWWLVHKRLLLHVVGCSDFVFSHKVDTEELEWALNALGRFYAGQGKLVEAEVMFERALQGYKEAGVEKNISALNTVHNLGSLYSKQGKLAEAEVMFERALQGYKEAGVEKNIPALDTVHNLGSLYFEQGKLAEAEAMYERALRGYKEAGVEKNIPALDTVHNLGSLYSKQGKLAEAEAMYEQALRGYKEAGVEKNIPALNTVHNLGSLYFKQGKLEEAEAMYERALQGYEKALSTEHVRVYVPALNSMRNMGDVLVQLGQKERAAQMYSDALAGFAVAQGQDSESCRRIRRRLEELEQLTSRGERLTGSQADGQSRFSRSRVKVYVKKLLA